MLPERHRKLWSIPDIPTQAVPSKINIGPLPSFKSPAVSSYFMVLSCRKNSLGDAGNINQFRGCAMFRRETNEGVSVCPVEVLLFMPNQYVKVVISTAFLPKFGLILVIQKNRDDSISLEFKEWKNTALQYYLPCGVWNVGVDENIWTRKGGRTWLRISRVIRSFIICILHVIELLSK
jgi:hypothetical protein